MEKFLYATVGLNGAFLAAAGIIWGIPIAACSLLLLNCEVPLYGLTTAGIGIVLGFVPSIAMYFLLSSRKRKMKNEV